MGVIRILTEKIASQIAAGEIIERPASVIRELLDNSVDAGASFIDINVEGGGKRLIRVKDNGSGMDRDDLLLCLERHGTSKISDASDLLAVKTLGFRGEALPSISAVSRLEITSRPEGQLLGHRVIVEGGSLKAIDETGAPDGTVVEARDLFFNMPARRKFLRSAKTEMDHVIDTVSRIALPFGHIHFRLKEGEKPVLAFPTTEKEVSRLSTLFGRQVAGSMEEGRLEKEGLAVRAFLAPADFTRSRGDRIYLYVNRRNIRDRLLIRAIMEGYGQRLMKGRYPYVVLFIEINPELVDVNIHPTKQELRFRNSQAVYQSVVSMIDKVMGRQISTVLGYDWEKSPAQDVGKGASAAEPKGEYGDVKLSEESIHEPAQEEGGLVTEGPRILAQLGGTYILCETDEGLLMIDQHAAHERIVYESLKRAIRSSRTETQYLLIPHQLELSRKDSRIILENLDQLAALGFEIDHFGGNTFLLRSVPSILVNVRWKEFFADLIALLEELGDVGKEEALDRFLVMAACHGAIKAGLQLSRDEMLHLIEELNTLDLPTNCPHGRPVFKEFRYHEIEKMFRRVL